MYKIDYNLSDEDYADFNIYTFLHTANGKASANGFRMTVLFAANNIFLLAILLSVDKPYVLIAEIVCLIITCIIIFAFSKKLLAKMTRRIASDAAKKGTLDFDREGTLIFDDEYILETSEKGEGKRKYAYMKEACRGENAVYVYISDNRAYIVPVSSLHSETEIQRFIAFVNDKITKGKTALAN